MGKKALTKKKGPKGKKARAKAKLDRQWGETVDEGQLQESRVRRGKSRLLKNRTKAIHQDETQTHFERTAQDFGRDAEAFDDDSSSDSDAEENDLVKDNALGELLRSINKRTKKTRKQTADDDKVGDAFQDDESEISSTNDMDHDSNNNPSDEESDEESDDDEKDNVESDKIDDDDVPDGVSESNNSATDPFASYFNKQSLHENESEFAKEVAASQNVRKIPTRHLDPALELYLSGSTFDELASSGFLLEPESNIPVSSVAQKWQEMTDSSFSWTRKVLRQGWRKFNKSARKRNADSGVEKRPQLFSTLQTTLYPPLSTYADMLITAESRENRDAVNNLLALHILNHVLTSRSRVQRHNRKLKELKQKAETENNVNIETDDDKFRDQGYTRPKVLILLPTRGTCLTLLQRMVALLGNSAIVDNMDRFEAEYGAPVADEDNMDDNDAACKRRKSVLEAKAPAWKELFGDDVNDDDDFKIGIAITPKAAGVSKKNKQGGNVNSAGGVSMKLYAEFYRSDIIIASPLGLKMSVTSDDGEEDVDFLSSIEICLIGHANVLLMQNWDHVNETLGLLNQQPKKNNDTDFSRVRHYFLAGQAVHWRQLMISSSLSDPFLLSTFKRHSKSIGGKLKLRRTVPTDEASLCDVLIKVKQVFHRVPCSSIAAQGDEKLQYFADNVLPQIARLKQKHTLIFIPSYFDFVSIRNLLLKREVDFVSVSEYARVSEVSRGRARFLQGRKPIMLYTGRCHFFSRHNIKGARHLLFFGLPEHAEFYPDMVNVLNEGLGGADKEENTVDLAAPASCLALFTKYDAHALERIVGSQNCERMVKAEKSTFIFSS